MIPTLNRDQFIKYAIDKRRDRFYFFDASIKDVDGKTNKFYAIEEAKDVKKEITEVAKNYPFKFKVLSFTQTGLNYDKAFVCLVDFRPEVNYENQPNPESTKGLYTESQLKDKMELFTVQQESKRKQEELTEELETIKGWEYKVMTVIDRIVEVIEKRKITPIQGQSMQGLTNETETSMSNETQKISDQDTKAALKRLVELLGRDRIVLMAQKLSKDQSIVPMLDGWLKS